MHPAHCNDVNFHLHARLASVVTNVHNPAPISLRYCNHYHEPDLSGLPSTLYTQSVNHVSCGRGNCHPASQADPGLWGLV